MVGNDNGIGAVLNFASAFIVSSATTTRRGGAWPLSERQRAWQARAPPSPAAASSHTICAGSPGARVACG